MTGLSLAHSATEIRHPDVVQKHGPVGGGPLVGPHPRGVQASGAWVGWWFRPATSAVVNRSEGPMSSATSS